ncbi:hypothetical protein DN460_24770 [Enterobacter cloacae]|nr:hypothetical protein DN460_24770 [Enterobacter cloacae]
MFAGKKSAQIREILISESAWEEMTCLFAPSLAAPATSRAGTTTARILRFIIIYYPHWFFYDTRHCRQ